MIKKRSFGFFEKICYHNKHTESHFKGNEDLVKKKGNLGEDYIRIIKVRWKI